MSVRAKFRTSSINSSFQKLYARNEDGTYRKDDNGVYLQEEVEVGTIRLFPVVDSDPTSENAKFYAATPAGQIELSIVNAAALSQFENGAEYYVDFTKVEK